MNREQLIESLSYMEKFQVIPDSLYDIIHHKRKKKNKAYTAGADRRFRSCLEYDSPNIKMRNIFLSHFAFSIAASLSVRSLIKPSISQLSDMLQIIGYTPEQMNEYVQSYIEIGIEPGIIPSQNLQQFVFLLSRALYDTLSDNSEWRRKKRRENNPALIRLQKLTKYMKDNELLFTDDLTFKTEAYDTYVVNHADSVVKIESIYAEKNEALKLINSYLDRIKDDRDREVSRLMDKMLDPTKPPKFAPFANPIIDIGINEITNLSQTTRGDGAFSAAAVMAKELNKMMEIGEKILPDEVKAVIKRETQEFDRITNATDEVLENIDEQLDNLKKASCEKMIYEDTIAVAEEAYQAIVAGNDEIFKLKIGRYIWHDFMTQCNLPMPVVDFEELEDEEDWDYICTQTNGKMGLKIFNEYDLINLKTDNISKEETVTLPISAALSKYSNRPVWSNLYIRKSHIKRFKEAGCSDRKARDLAIVLGTLAFVDKIENTDYYTEYDNLFDLGYSSVINTIEKTVTEKVPAVPPTVTDKEKEELERSLKQQRKENQSCRHEINNLQRKVESLQQELEQMKHQRQESEISEEEAAVTKEKISFPYRTKLKVVIYGGFDVFHRSLLKLLPDVRIIEVSAHVDLKPFKNADIVFLQINKTDHASYWSVCDACKGAGVPYLHLNYSSAKKCAEVMVEEINKIG
ncbi:MAG: hypothetical protein LUC97_11325 [Clostridiales bacterium]|nr:hypothetical protein [Clostridiales bacterium]